MLLETLAEFQVSVPEVGTFTTETPPYVILTSNNTRDLSAALKRRCLHLFLDYPTAERELEIVRSKHTGLPEALAKQLVGHRARAARAGTAQVAVDLRDHRLGAHAGRARRAGARPPRVLADTASVVVKYDKDVRKAIGALPRLVDPNADGPEAGHGHGHGHGRTMTPPSLTSTPTTDDRRTARGCVRRRTGRAGTARAPTATRCDRAGPAGDDHRSRSVRGVTSGQGSRSFGLGRKRAL